MRLGYNHKAAGEFSPAALFWLYYSKFSYSGIKQNSPNILPTVKRFKLLRLGAGCDTGFFKEMQ